MAILTVLYPRTDATHFDHRYYAESHIVLVKSLLASHGLMRIDLLRGYAALGGGKAPFEMIGNIHLRKIDDIAPALQQHGAQIMADIANFTDIQPILQISEDVLA